MYYIAEIEKWKDTLFSNKEKSTMIVKASSKEKAESKLQKHLEKEVKDKKEKNKMKFKFKINDSI